MRSLSHDAAGLVAFVKTVELESFSAAGRALGLSQSAISKSIVALEQRLNVKLLQRSTRNMNPTAEGQAYYERVAPLLRAIVDAEDVLQSASTVSGCLRVSASQELGRMLVARWSPQFLAEFPDVSLDLGVTDRLVDIIREGYDLALRVGDLPDSDLSSRKIGKIPFVLVASPEYIERRGRPMSLEAIESHSFIRYVSKGRPWPYLTSDGRKIPASGRFVTDDSSSIREAALCHAGIAYLLRVTVAQDISDGSLTPILPEIELPSMPVYALHAFGRQLPRRGRVFVDRLAAHLDDLL